jgi:ATP synthase F1 gamma subunit
MPTIADIKIELEDATTLRLISSAFTEASAARIQKIKNAFETNRQFYDEISHVYHLVRVAGEAHGAENGKTVTKPPTKTISVAVTSNQRFYGNLNVNIMHGFSDEIGKTQGDIMVIGTTGQEYMRSTGYVQKYTKFNFLHDNPTTEETKAFIDAVEPYDSVMVYYPKFVSLVTQTVGIIDLTQTVAIATDKPTEEELQILFEPEYKMILRFFARQVRNLLFAHVMLEADLSRTAARLLTMSAAEERSTELIKQKKSALRKIQMSIANAKLLETFAGIKQWKK